MTEAELTVAGTMKTADEKGADNGKLAEENVGKKGGMTVCVKPRVKR